MRKLFFHIGSPKAGSTFLQRNVFPKSTQFRYLGRNLGLGTEMKPMFNFVNDLYFSEERVLNQRFNAFYQYLIQLEEEKFNDIESSKPLLISFETFVSTAVKPRKSSSSFYSGDLSLAFKRLIKFAKAYSFDLHIIYIQRNFKDFLFSYYAQSYSQYRNLFPTAKLELFLRAEINFNNYQTGLFWMYGENMKSLIQNHIEQSKIYFLSFENLINNPISNDRYLMNNLLHLNLQDFISQKENVRELTVNIKKASLADSNHKKKSLFKSLKLAWECFWFNYQPYEKLNTTITWSQECDELVKQLEDHFERLTYNTFKSL